MIRAAHVGIDPGSKNYAMAALDARGRLVFCRMLQNTVWSTAQANSGLRAAYRRAVWGILRGLRPTAVTCESFTVRGFGTNSIEMVGLMNGAMQMCCDRLGVAEHMVMPSQWKGWLIKRLGHEMVELYEYARERCVPPHVVDAICLAHYSEGGHSFDRLRAPRLMANIRAAGSLLPERDLIKPRTRPRKVKPATKKGKR